MPTFPFSSALVDEIRRSCKVFERHAVDDTALRRAAVAIVLVEMPDGSGEAGLLLTRRTATLRSHGGQFALPGGRIDEGETAVEAAIRECAEELGLAFTQHDVLGLLDDCATRSGYVITPVVLCCSSAQTIVPNPDEVAEVHHIGLGQITREGAAEIVTIAESDRPVLRLRINDNARIYAPTAAMLHQFAELVAGRTTRIAGFEQPVFAWR